MIASEFLGSATRESIALVFAFAGLLKLWRPASVGSALAVLKLPPQVVEPTAILTGVGELGAAAALLLIDGWLGVVPAAALLCAFSLFLLLLARRAPSAPCGCFGDFSSRSHYAGLGRNLALAVLLAVSAANASQGLQIDAIPAAIELCILAILVPDAVSLLVSVSREPPAQ